MKLANMRHIQFAQIGPNIYSSLEYFLYVCHSLLMNVWSPQNRTSGFKHNSVFPGFVKKKKIIRASKVCFLMQKCVIQGTRWEHGSVCQPTFSSTRDIISFSCPPPLSFFFFSFSLIPVFQTERNDNQESLFVSNS